MAEVVVVTNNFYNFFDSYIQKDCSSLYMKQDSYQYGIWKFWSEGNKTLHQNIAELLTEFITSTLTRVLLNNLLANKHWHFDDNELEFIVTQGEKKVNSQLTKWEKTRIYQNIVEYLANTSYLVIEGYITFRLAWYLRELDDVLEDVIDEYLMDKEYQDFLELLKYFVDIQDVETTQVHLVFQNVSHNNYKMFDDQGKIIKEDYLKKLVNDLTLEDVQEEEFIVSILLSISPRKIILHNNTKAKFPHHMSNILQEMFNNKVRYCNGCSICGSNIYWS